MTRYVFMIDTVTNRAALFLEPTDVGDPKDPNSPRNAPLNNPTAYMSYIRFHSDFDYYNVAVGPLVRSVSFPQRNGETTTIIASVAGSPSLTRQGRVINAHHTLYTHSLGYVPSYMIIFNGSLLSPSTILQTSSLGTRRVTPYATATAIGLYETAITTAAGQNISAASLSFTVVIFRQPLADSPYKFDYVRSTGRLSICRGKFKNHYQALRVARSGDPQPFDIPLGRTVDIRGGGSRTVSASGAIATEPRYTGSFTGSPSVDGAIG